MDSEMEPCDCGDCSEMSVGASFKFSLLGAFIDMAEALLENLKAHHNWRVGRVVFNEAAALEIETITQES